MRISKQLNDAQVRSLGKLPGTHNVGGVAGLTLQVSTTGARSWVLRATIAGRVRWMGLGPYSHVSLAEARDLAAKARAAIRDGRDPVAEREAAKRALEAAERRALTFKQATELYFTTKKRDELRGDDSRRGWLRGLELHAWPIMGELPVGEVEFHHVLSVLTKPAVVHSKYAKLDVREKVRVQVLTTRWPSPSMVALRGGIESVLAWAKVNGYRSGENPASWRGNLKEALPIPSRAHKVEHLAAIPYLKAPEFVAALRSATDEVGIVTASVLEIIILTAARSGQVRGATWDEFDFDKRIWTVPGERMKSGLTHRVPLTDRVVELLKSLPRAYASDRRIFAVRARNKGGVRVPYDWEIGAANKFIAARLGLGDFSVHGHRSSFKDWCRNCATRYADEVSELALSHVSNDSTRSAYARDELMGQRTKLMTEWADYLEHGPTTADVIDISKARG